MRTTIDVSKGGAVRLGSEVVCDGFIHAGAVRVQTHIHDDHMSDFESSKGYQEIITSEGTRHLLISEHDADLPYRSNFRAIPDGVPYRFDDSIITLKSSGHMLGSVQTCVEVPGGVRVGYSGDFQWPLDDVIQVEGLVVDSTYGSPSDVREFTQGECEGRFMQLVRRQLESGPVHVIAHRGTLQRAMQLLTDEVPCVVVGTRRLQTELEVYRRFGYTIGEVVCNETAEGREALRGDRYIRVYGARDPRPVYMGTRGTQMKLSAFMTRPDDPITVYSERAFGVALSNHADFNGTIEYVRQTGATYVVTDNSRGGKAYELAIELHRRLGVEARASTNFESREWGT